MKEIIPAILAPDFKTAAARIRQMEGRANWVHLDVADGLFTPAHSWRRPADLLTLDGRVKIEIHLMVEHPEQELKEWQAAADRILVHYESTELVKLEQILEAFEDSSTALGLALLLPTPLEALERFAERLKFVQLMGIARIGYQGQEFAPTVIERVRVLRERYPDVTIEVDGGVSLENAPALFAAGADNLVVGSALWQSSDPVATLRQFQSLIPNP